VICVPLFYHNTWVKQFSYLQRMFWTCCSVLLSHVVM
jgi:hypothetical protein